MKKVVLACLLFVSLFDVSYAPFLCKVGCTTEVQNGERDAKKDIEDAYNDLYDAIDDLKDAYDDYKKAIEDQNKLLEKLQTLKVRNALLEKQILFLRTQDKELVGLSIDGAATKKGAK
jgi:SMC interacting uncharacterized protein involved in chromosome segregation